MSSSMFGAYHKERKKHNGTSPLVIEERRRGMYCVLFTSAIDLCTARINEKRHIFQPERAAGQGAILPPDVCRTPRGPRLPVLEHPGPRATISYKHPPPSQTDKPQPQATRRAGRPGTQPRRSHQDQGPHTHRENANKTQHLCSETQD